ncbi:unnamed protein product [Paramecium octaurelia]|uniref:Uncharacterized protein n=1 Tax=Paramecium octaurelia TaxID=43137 RepID=A0A8S1XD28_PAROT|nr:unnamed protein product [Paramecium octaurelia]
MESRNLTQFQHYTHNGTNRYSIQRIVYPQYASGLVQEETVSQHKDSIDEDQFIEGECFVYIGGQQIFTIELKQPDFVHQQLCIDLTKYQCPLECLTAFPLPNEFQNTQRILPLSTGILVVSSGKNGQQIKLFDDQSKEININIQITKRIIWMNSRYLQEVIILIVGFNDLSVGLFEIDIKNKLIRSLQEFIFEQLIIFNDISTQNQKYYIALTSYNGIISIISIDLFFNIQHHVHNINRITSPPKLYFQHNKANLMVPIQNGEMLQYCEIEDNGLKKWNVIKYQNNNKSMITAFDIEPKKCDISQNQSEEFEICMMHFDGTLSFYDYADNSIYIEISKQLNGSRFFMSNMQLSFKQFILIGSDDEVEIYQMSFYHIN